MGIKSDRIKSCGRWFDILDEKFREIPVMTSGLSILEALLGRRISE